MVFSPSSRFSYQNFLVSVTLDIVLPSRAQCPWRLPYPRRYLLVCVPSWTPVLHGRSKCFCGLWGFPLNNREKYIRPSFCLGQQRRGHPRFFPFHRVTTVLQD